MCMEKWRGMKSVEIVGTKKEKTGVEEGLAASEKKRGMHKKESC